MIYNPPLRAGFSIIFEKLLSLTRPLQGYDSCRTLAHFRASAKVLTRSRYFRALRAEAADLFLPFP